MRLDQKFRCILLPGLLVGLAGCGPQQGEDLWQDYINRLERLTGTIAAPAKPARRDRYPRHRDLLQPVSEQRTGLLRYLNLLDCDLMTLVSERNSVLGRVQRESLRLDYELRFISGGQRCLASDRLQDDAEMARWLADIVDEKIRDLPSRGWNLGFAGPELAGYFRQRPVPAGSPSPPEWPATVEALARLRTLMVSLAMNPVPARLEADIEQALERLDKSSAGGQILDALALAIQELDRAATVLEQVDSARLCPHGKASERARYLQNVLFGVYAGQIQPWLADLSRAAQPLADATLSLRASQREIVSPGLDRWLAAQFGEDGLTARYPRALDRHSRAWQRLLGDCGLMPDASSRTRMITD